jgi:hypothetical protein
VVYVNQIARKPMLTEKKPSFPQGSIIVREKLETETSATPALLSVMIKREKGFSPGNGDWEYIVADEADGKLQMLERKIDCTGCHSSQIEHDYVFRTYMPEPIEQVIKVKYK